MSKKNVFGPLERKHVEIAYSIIEQRFTYLQDKGIHQYARPYPPSSLFLENQALGINYALYNGDGIAGLVTISQIDQVPGWNATDTCKNSLWLTSLYSNPANRGKGAGYRILDEVCLLGERESKQAIYLDCYKDGGFLEQYYSRFGFSAIAEKFVEYPGHSFNACLMELILSDTSDE